MPAKIKISSLIFLLLLFAYQHIKYIETIFNNTYFRNGPHVCVWKLPVLKMWSREVGVLSGEVLELSAISVVLGRALLLSLLMELPCNNK